MSSACRACQRIEEFCDGLSYRRIGQLQYCDGSQPCFECKNAEPPRKCDYDDNKSQVTGVLKRGFACKPCRLKKKKCDGEKPVCGGCAAASTPGQCLYVTLRKGHGKSKSKSKIDSPESPQLGLGPTLYSATPLSSQQSGPSSPPSGLQQIGSWDRVQIPPVPTGGVFEVSSGGLGQDHRLLPNLHPVQTYTSLFFQHQVQFGITFSLNKYNAVQSEDFTGHVIHPCLVHIVHLWGCVLWHRSKRSNDVEEELVYKSQVFQSLQDPNCRQPSPLELLQLYLLLSAYLFCRSDQNQGIHYIRLAAAVVQENNMHLFDINANDIILELSEETQTICWLLCYASYPFFPYEIPYALEQLLTQEFESLRYSHPEICADNLVTTRTAALVCLRQAREHAKIWINVGYGDVNVSSDMFMAYTSLVRKTNDIMGSAKLGSISASFSTALKSTELAYKTTILIMHTVSIILHRGPALLQTESKRHYIDSIGEIIRISETFTPQDYPLLDPSLIYCWFTVADIAIREQLGPSGLFSGIELLQLNNYLGLLRVNQKKLLDAVPFNPVQ